MGTGEEKELHRVTEPRGDLIQIVADLHGSLGGIHAQARKPDVAGNVISHIADRR